MMHEYHVLGRQRIDRELAERRWRNYQFAQEILHNENAQPRGLRIWVRRLFERFSLPKRQASMSQHQPPCGELPLSAR